jgi:hypothetical protein
MFCRLSTWRTSWTTQLSVSGCTVVILCPLLLLLFVTLSTATDFYTNQWAVRVIGGEKVARKLASEHGFEFIATILEDYYLFQHRRVSKRSIFASSVHHASLADEPQVLWVGSKWPRKESNVVPSAISPTQSGLACGI